MAGGKRRGGGRQRRTCRRRRLEDPVGEVDVDLLIKKLQASRLVDEDELKKQDQPIPRHLWNESVLVQSKNRGLRTIYIRMAHLRRRYLSLLVDGKSCSKEGNYVLEKLESYEDEVIIIQDQINDKKGSFYKMPGVLTKKLMLKK